MTDSFASRQKGNDALTCFLKALTSTGDRDLYEIFFCHDCEKRDKDGNRWLDGIAMDGTALGILRILPNFMRETNVIPAITRVTGRQ